MFTMLSKKRKEKNSTIDRGEISYPIIDKKCGFNY